MFVEKKKNESNNETCMRCVEEYLKLFGTFDYSYCAHCKISQKIHEKDSKKWNGHCRFMR